MKTMVSNVGASSSSSFYRYLQGGGCLCKPGYESNVEKQTCNGEFPIWCMNPSSHSLFMVGAMNLSYCLQLILILRFCGVMHFLDSSSKALFRGGPVFDVSFRTHLSILEL